MNIKIKEVGIYHPKTSVNNDFYIDHFQKQGKDISRFVQHMGRKDRYINKNKDENALTMAVEAAKTVLGKAEMMGKDIDMLVFSTQTPEYTFPTNAMFLHNAIEGDKHTIVMDSNANCAGMTVAVEQASRYMKANPNVKTALIVGSDYNSLLCDPEDEITYSNYGDAAAAVILETTQEDAGFIDSVYAVDSKSRNNIVYPEQGLANTLRGEASGKYIKWIPFDGSESMNHVMESFETIFERNNLTKADIDTYCFSQFSLATIKEIQERFNIDNKQIVYVGDRFGYTGTSSPFIVLHEGIKSGKIKRGDYLLFWTIGAGYQIITMLFKY
ncbi:ketoacyl-ACP synthase III [Oceanobacillus sp. FSL K6-2867]|uniref:ketoacyl-ACP synthase III n=1 Tax=Oceanobacillus sp. FSL K6-2867 TaxID=2954748 RepID=UPI0030D71CA6